MRRLFRFLTGKSKTKDSEEEDPRQKDLPDESAFTDLYTTGKVLGTGSFALVKEAKRKADGEKLAVKTIDKHKLSEAQRDLLLSEISVLSKISHPNIIALRDFIETKEHFHLITDLATGGELFDEIIQRGKFTEKDAAHIIKTVLETIQYFHGMDIVHRDLKPENLLLKEPNSTTIMLTDFGLSKIAHKEDILKTACGTPGYVAPEVLLKKGYGKAVDIWSTGVITYILLSGQPPFFGQDLIDLYTAIIDGDYDFEDSAWSKVSESAKTFIEKLLDPDPSTRPTAEEALQDPWLKTECETDLFTSTRAYFDAKKVFKKAAYAVQAGNRMQKKKKNEKPRLVLPTNVKPVHYLVDLTPNFETFTFAGRVEVSLKVNQDSTSITCNTNEIDIQKAFVLIKKEDGQQETIESKAITYDTQLEQATIELAAQVTKDSNATLVIEFTGIHNDKMAGFYRSGFKDKDGNQKWMVVTQFEACDCRRAFPCWDEPALKATFDVILRVPCHMTALSNMNSVETVTDATTNLNVVKYATTPIMSTYLVAFAVGEFDYVETVARPKKPSNAEPITVRVYANKGEAEKGQFALEVAARTLEYFSEYFDTPYPLPKMDMIAVSDFSAGAMENWGLVTYRSVILLFDEKTNSAANKQDIAYVVCHELAHQWFGNLVTMEWWQDLWLNEGFATFVGWMAVDKLFPKWDVWTQFVNDELSDGLNLDALRSSHPIEVEINQIFDDISYSKGASLIRMLNGYLGEQIFMNGVRTYLKEFAYSNATTNDLWKHLSMASDKDVSTLMNAWTRRTGYPMVSVLHESYNSKKKEMTLTLKQSRFLSSGDWTEEEENDVFATIWWIPLGIVTHKSKTPFDLILKDKTAKITFPYEKGPKSFWKINYNTQGFYRVRLPEDDLIRLSQHALDGLSESDRVGFISDAFSMAQAGYGSTVGALEALKNVQDEGEYIALNEMIERLNALMSIFYKEPPVIVNGLKALKKEILSKKAEKLGWEYPANEGHLDSLKRTMVLSNAAKAGDEKVIEEFKNRLERVFSGDETALDANLRKSAFSVYLRNSSDPAAAFDTLFGWFTKEVREEQRLAALRSLGASNSIEMVKKLLNDIVLDKQSVRPQDIASPLAGIAYDNPNPTLARPELWTWWVDHFEEISTRLSGSLGLFGRVFSVCVGEHVGYEFADTVEKWTVGELGCSSEEEKEKRKLALKPIESNIKQELEKVKSNTKWVVRERDHLLKYFGGPKATREVLPENVTPTHYLVDLTPNFDSFKFTGSVDVHLKVNEMTSRITCNAFELEIESAFIKVTNMKTESSQSSTSISYDEKMQTVDIDFANPIPAGSTAVLHIKFTGEHNDKLAGFYRSGYKDKDGNQKWMVVTQFEACDCRRAFPCWDEPALKATFDVILRVPAYMTALSNMDAIEETTAANGLKVFKYAKTPIMSTYLVAFAVGEFDFVETVSTPTKPADAKPITVRVYTNKGESEQGKFALEVAARTLEFFSEYFDIRYPLPKMDLIAVPDFAMGAMENWGLVTFRSVLLLFDEKTTSARIKQRIAYIVGHELAHQWFGNLVTMEWWQDLWLNEGFATFVGWMAVDHLYPEWDVWTQFALQEVSRGIALDSLRNSHPIEVDVNSPKEIGQIFDAISYCKGASVIQMLSWYLGQETFMKGVRSYLKEFAYSNAITSDLWNHLSQASGKDVEALMKEWTGATGFPMVTILSENYDAKKKQMTLHLKQSRFLSSGDWTEKEEKDPKSTIWWIPLGIFTDAHPEPFDLMMNAKESKVTFPYEKTETSFWKLNYKARGFYRVRLDSEHVKRLSLLAASGSWSLLDRMSLVSDAFSMAQAGYGSTVAALEVVRNFKDQTDYLMLNELNDQLNSISSIWYKESPAVLASLQSIKKSIFAPKVAQVGWDYPQGEGHLISLKRNLVIGAAAKAGDEATISELKTRLTKFIQGDTAALHPNLFGAAVLIFLQHSDNPKNDFDTIVKFYKEASSLEQKLTALGALGAINSIDVVDTLLNDLVLDTSFVRTQDLMYPINGLAHESPLPGAVRAKLWTWFTTNWDTLVERYTPTMSLLARIMQGCVESSVGLDFLNQVEQWSTGQVACADEEEKTKRVDTIKGINTQLNQALENVKAKSKWVERERGSLENWAASLSRDILPAWVTPSHYKVDITPNFDTFTFNGTVDVTLRVNETTQRVKCNAFELQVQSASIKVNYLKTETVQTATKISYDEKAQIVTFDFAHPIPAGSSAVLSIKFTGIHNDKMAGFYRSGFKDKDGNQKWMVVTQFEACDCRRAFPCWDEPALKATFDVILRVPCHMTALSNMNDIEESTVDGLKVVKYATTPIMSTYLVAFAVGEFDYVETTSRPTQPDNAQPIRVRVYTNKGESEQGKFALEVAARTLEFFSGYFDIPYPLPKMDMIAVPDFSAGAMENWGLVTYRTVRLLYDEKTSSAQGKQGIAYVVGHELAHQWFGNLVTMEWWSDLWLNEGFATFVGWLAVDHLFPEWDVWTQFVIGDLTNGLTLDALRSSHPIQVDVKSPHEILQIFDAISYSKGASLIRMLNWYLGQETFMKGVRSYLKEFAYSNAATEDLWKHLSAASNKDVSALMKPWTREMGYPMITIMDQSYDANRKEMTLSLKQSRFLSSGDWTDKEENDPKSTTWWIPLGIFTDQTQEPLDLILTSKQQTITFPFEQTDSSFWKLNYRCRGFFRVNLAPEYLEKLSQLPSSKMSLPDRVNLVADAFSLAEAGYGSTLGALQVVENFKQEQDYIILNKMMGHINQLISIQYLEDPVIVKALKKLKLKIVESKLNDVGWDFPAGEDHLTSLKRSLVLGSAAKADDEGVASEFRTRFYKFVQGDDSALHPNLRSIAFSVLLRTTTDATRDFDAVLKIYKETKSADERIAALTSLGAVQSMEIVEKLLNELVLDADLVRPQDVMYPLAGLSGDNPNSTLVRPALWTFLVNQWPKLVERYGTSMGLLGHVLQRCIVNSIGHSFVDQVKAWSCGEGLGLEEQQKRIESIKSVQSKLDQALEKIVSNTRWVERSRHDLASWAAKQ